MESWATKVLSVSGKKSSGKKSDFTNMLGSHTYTFYTTNALQLISTKYLDTNSALDFNRIFI